MRATAVEISAGSFRGQCIGWWERLLRFGRRSPKRLRLCESLALGDRRFVAVVEFDCARFLVGGTPSSLVLLSQLADAEKQSDQGQPGGSNLSSSDPFAEPGRSRRGKAC
jgi:flagellar biogenesis protein FliO